MDSRQKGKRKGGVDTLVFKSRPGRPGRQKGKRSGVGNCLEMKRGRLFNFVGKQQDRLDWKSRTGLQLEVLVAMIIVEFDSHTEKEIWQSRHS